MKIICKMLGIDPYWYKKYSWSSFLGLGLFLILTGNAVIAYGISVDAIVWCFVGGAIGGIGIATFCNVLESVVHDIMKVLYDYASGNASARYRKMLERVFGGPLDDEKEDESKRPGGYL